MTRPALRVVAGLLLGAASAATWPEAVAQPQQPTFRSGVTLLAIDVTVLDGDGRPQPGLTGDDFDVEIDGRRTPVRTLDFVSVEAPRYTAVVGASAPGPAVATPVVPRTRANPLERTFLLFVDDLSFSLSEHKSIMLAAERFLATLRPEDRVGLVTSSGRQGVVPARDRGPVVRAIRTVSGRFDSPQWGTSVRYKELMIEGEQIALSEAVRISRYDQSLRIAVARREGGEECASDEACLRVIDMLANTIAHGLEFAVDSQARAWIAAAQALSQVEGAKVLVVMSGGLPAELAGPAIRSFSRIVANSGISVQVIGGVRADVSAEDRMFPGSSGTGQDRRRQDNPFFLDGLRDAAARAGGSFYPAVGGSDDDFARILLATSARYRIGVELPPASAPGTVLKTRVKLKRSGLRVFAASEYTTPGPPPVLTTEQQLRAIVSQGDAHYAVPVTVTTLVRRHPGGSALELGLHVEVPGTTPPPLDVVFAVLGDTGRVVQSGRTRIDRTSAAETQAFVLAVPVPPGTYRLRMGVADSAGNVGSSEQTITVRLSRMGGLMASQLFARAAGPGDRTVVLSGDAIPESATHLDVGMELYRDATAAVGVTREAKITLKTEAGEPIQDRTVPLSSADGAWYAGVRVPLQALPAGRYAMSFALLEAGAVVAQVSRGVTKTTEAASPSLELPGAATPPAALEDTAAVAAAALPRLTPGLPSREDVLAILRRDAASARPAPDVARLLDRAAVAVHIAAMPSAPPESVPSATLPEAAFWASVEQLGRTSGVHADFARGLAAIHRRDWATAVTSLERTLDAAPDALVALQYLGATHAGIGEDRDAAGAWALSLQATGATVKWHLAYADVLVRAQDPSGAIHVLTDAKARWPDDARVRVRYGELLLAAGRTDQVRVELDRAIALAPRHERALFLAAALAFADVAGNPAPDVVAAFERRATEYLAVTGDTPSPVAEWRRLVATALK